MSHHCDSREYVFSNKYVHCQEMMVYGSMATFEIGICRKVDNSAETAFRMNLETSSKAALDGVYSILVDEIEYTFNDKEFHNLKKGGYDLPFLYDDNLLDPLQSLSIHLSIYFS